jgi:hypothetical protein
MSWEPVLKKISKLQDGSQSGLVKWEISSNRPLLQAAKDLLWSVSNRFYNGKMVRSDDGSQKQGIGKTLKNLFLQSSKWDAGSRNLKCWLWVQEEVANFAGWTQKFWRSAMDRAQNDQGAFISYIFLRNKAWVDSESHWGKRFPDSWLYWNMKKKR